MVTAPRPAPDVSSAASREFVIVEHFLGIHCPARVSANTIGGMLTIMLLNVAGQATFVGLRKNIRIPDSFRRAAVGHGYAAAAAPGQRDEAERGRFAGTQRLVPLDTRDRRSGPRLHQ